MSDQPQTGPTLGQLRAYLEARDAHDAAQVVEAKTKEDEREAMLEVFDAIRAAGIKGAHKVDVGPPWGTVSFTPGTTPRGDIYDEDALAEWVRENGRETEMMGEPTFRKKPINALVKRALAGHAEIPAGVEPAETKRVSVRHFG